MSHLPALRSKKRLRFASPLAGLFFNNKQYQHSCLFEEVPLQQQRIPFTKNKSNPTGLLKKQPIRIPTEQNPQSNSDVFTKTSKVSNISNRLANPSSKRCSRNHWFSSEELPAQGETHLRKAKSKAIELDAEINNQKALFYIKPFKFAEIQVTILDLIAQGKEEKRFKLDLKRYYQAFFKQNLSGGVFQELSVFVQQHIDEVIGKQQSIVRQASEQKYVITSKRILYQRLLQMQKSQKFQERNQLLQSYCIPKKQLRDIFLRDVINLIVIQLYESFDLSKDKEYVLLTSSGQIITDFSQIKFSTRRLFVADGARAAEYYQRYLQYLKDKSTSKGKHAFRETLKQNFRQHLTHGKYEQANVPYRPYRQEIAQKRNNLTRAQRILSFKNDKHNQGRAKFLQFMKLEKSGETSKEKRVQSRSPSNKLQQNTKTIFSTEERIIQQFMTFKRQNDYIDAAFKNDQTCKNKVQLGLLVQKSVYFRTKTQNQINRILHALQFITLGEQIQGYQKRTITLQQYIQMRKIINCLSSRQKIIHFVDKYLNYDDYGELQKQDLRQTLGFVIGGQKKTSQVILLTIWSWLQKNGVITNQSLRRSNMQMMYERNKLVYYFLISLIFGTNETTALELAHQILV